MKLIVYPSWVMAIVNDLERSELDNFLTIDVPNAKHTFRFKRKQWDGKQRFLNRGKNVFPIGFLNRVTDEFHPTEVVDNRVYVGIPFKIFPMHGIDMNTPERYYQKLAVLYAYQYRNCLVEAATNSGKSAIMSCLIKLLMNERVVIVVHRVELLNQLRNMIRDAAQISVGYITAADTVIDRFVNIAMIKTLQNRIDLDDEITRTYFESKVLIVDECHHLKAATYKSIFLRSKAIYRFGFSGTVQDENSYDGWRVREFIGDVVFKVSNKEMIDAGISAMPEIEMIRCDHDIDYPAMTEAAKAQLDADAVELRRQLDNDELMGEEKKKAKKRLKALGVLFRYRQMAAQIVYREAVNENIIRNPHRDEMFCEKIEGEYKDKQVLIVVDSIEHGDRIYERLWAGKCKNNVSFIHGSSKTRAGSLKMFKEGELRVLISSNIIDEGIDTDAIQVLVFAGTSKSRRQVLQRIGRGLRRKTGENIVRVLDFDDKDGKYLAKHSRERKKIYGEEGFKFI